MTTVGSTVLPSEPWLELCRLVDRIGFDTPDDGERLDRLARAYQAGLAKGLLSPTDPAEGATR